MYVIQTKFFKCSYALCKKNFFIWTNSLSISINILSAIIQTIPTIGYHEMHYTKKLFFVLNLPLSSNRVIFWDLNYFPARSLFFLTQICIYFNIWFVLHKKLKIILLMQNLFSLIEKTQFRSTLSLSHFILYVKSCKFW